MIIFFLRRHLVPRIGCPPGGTTGRIFRLAPRRRSPRRSAASSARPSRGCAAGAASARDIGTGRNCPAPSWRSAAACKASAPACRRWPAMVGKPRHHARHDRHGPRRRRPPTRWRCCCHGRLMRTGRPPAWTLPLAIAAVAAAIAHGAAAMPCRPRQAAVLRRAPAPVRRPDRRTVTSQSALLLRSDAITLDSTGPHHGRPRHSDSCQTLRRRFVRLARQQASFQHGAHEEARSRAVMWPRAMGRNSANLTVPPRYSLQRGSPGKPLRAAPWFFVCSVLSASCGRTRGTGVGKHPRTSLAANTIAGRSGDCPARHDYGATLDRCGHLDEPIGKGGCPDRHKHPPQSAGQALRRQAMSAAASTKFLPNL